MTNNITGKQAALICSIMIFASKLLILPSLLYEVNNFGGFLCLIILLLSEFIFLFVLIKIKLTYKNINLFDFISQKIGKILTIFIYVLLFIFFFLKLLYILQESFSFLKENLYSEATILVFLICLLPVINACVFKGLKAFGRTLEIFYLVIIIGILFSSFIWLTSVSNFSLTILNNNGFNGLINGLFDYSFWFGDYFFFMLFIDKIKLKKTERKYIYFYSVLSSLILLVFYFAYFYIYQTTAFSHTNALTDIIQFTTNLGSVSRLDLIAITAMMFLVYFQSSTFLFCMQECLCKIFPFKHKAQPLIVSNIIIVIFMYYIFNNNNNIIIFYSDYFRYLAIFLVFILPIILLFFLIKYKDKKETKI